MKRLIVLLLLAACLVMAAKRNRVVIVEAESPFFGVLYFSSMGEARAIAPIVAEAVSAGVCQGDIACMNSARDIRYREVVIEK
jgi:hypothetical protein